MIVLRPPTGPPWNSCVVFTVRDGDRGVVFSVGEPVRLIAPFHGYGQDHIWWIYKIERGDHGGSNVWIRSERKQTPRSDHELTSPYSLVKLNAMERIAVEASV